MIFVVGNDFGRFRLRRPRAANAVKFSMRTCASIVVNVNIFVVYDSGILNQEENKMGILLTEAAAGAGGSGMILVAYVVLFGVFIYFMMVRPQKKEQKRMTAMLSALEIGDSILTTSGFYGIVIDITDDAVIAEFGNNKNCRIPMQKTAIAQVEKASEGDTRKA